MTIRIAIDCMGGDFGVKVTVPAAIHFVKSHPDTHIILVGKLDQISRKLKRYPHDPEQISVIDAEEIISMDEGPAQALRSKKKSSMRIAIDLIKDGQAKARVGNEPLLWLLVLGG